MKLCFHEESFILAERTQFAWIRDCGYRPHVTGNAEKKQLKINILEALWIIPLYFICPLVGIIILLIGVIKKRNGSSKKNLIVGLTLLFLPLFHLALITIFQFGLENKISGKYSVGNETGILEINKNGTFILRNSIQYKNSGSGTWEIEEIDFPILKLTFNQKGKSELWLQIDAHQNTISLSSMSWGNDISNEFTKELHSR